MIRALSAPALADLLAILRRALRSLARPEVESPRHEPAHGSEDGGGGHRDVTEGGP